MPEVTEQTEIAPPQAQKKKKSVIPPNMMGMLTKAAVFGLIGLVAVFAAYMLTLKVLKPTMAHKAQTTQVQKGEKTARTESAAKPKADHAQASGDHGGGEEGHGSSSDAKFYNIENVVVNPAGTAGTRFLSCGVSFELENGDDAKFFESKGVQIKDILITILSSKTVDELSDIQLRNRMRQQILATVNRYAAPTKAKAVFLTDFVLQ